MIFFLKGLSYFIGLPKTIIFNFLHLPFQQAIKLPILVSRHVCLRYQGGKIILPYAKTAMIKIGFGDIAIFDRKKSRTVWSVGGTVEFLGTASIGHGSKISVAGELIIGDGFRMSAESSIVAASKVVIGHGVLISWDVLIMDTDFHKVFEGERQLNPNRTIHIGDKVWIGCRALILKGSHIPDGVVVAAATTVSRSIDECCSIVAGSPAKVIKSDITWED
ncbi:MAG: acyltransferase [Mariprofundus sp.]|nr:acyltransferase [Mariprofundus sp.]